MNEDHEVVARAVTRACTSAQALGYESPLPPLKYLHVFLFESTIPMTEWEEFNPDPYVDVTEAFEIKKRALSALVSQPELPDWYGRLAERRAHQARSLTQNTAILYAEGFKRYLPAVRSYLG